jgi:hypothetical protein
MGNDTKVTTVMLGGALATILLAVLGPLYVRFIGEPLPSGIEGALTTALTALLAYVLPKDFPPRDGIGPTALLVAIMLACSGCASSAAFVDGASVDDQIAACHQIAAYRDGWEIGVDAAAATSGGSGAIALIDLVAAEDEHAAAVAASITTLGVATFAFIANKLEAWHAKQYVIHGCKTLQE